MFDRVRPASRGTGCDIMESDGKWKNITSKSSTVAAKKDKAGMLTENWQF